MARAIVDAGLGSAGAAASLLDRVDVASAAAASGISEEKIRAVAREFANGGRSLAVGPGIESTHRQATSVAAAVSVLNYVAGNRGRRDELDRGDTVRGRGD